MTEASREPDWTKVFDYLQPKPPLFTPEEPSLTQKVFLRTLHIEALFGGSAGGGKALPCVMPIPTPSGFQKMEDIRPGDFILGRDGRPHVVLAESEIMHLPGWRLTFDDGSEVTCNDDHLWLTLDSKELGRLTKSSEEWKAARREKRASRSNIGAGQKWNHTEEHRRFLSESITERNRTNPTKSQPPPTGTVRTTAEIVATLTVRNGRRNHAIPVAEALDLPERELPVDPYALGAWLGDGNARDGQICSADPEILHQVDEHYRRRWTREQGGNFWMVCYEGLRLDLKSIGVLGNKHIPHDYLWASEAQRLALLQGLMDTDGTVCKTGSAEFCNTNLHIAEGVAHLVRSLGMKATLREGRAKLNGRDCGPKWTVKFMANRIVFRLPRKATLQKIAERRTTKFRYIVAAERVDPQPMKCIKVSSPDHLYLVGEHFIPTHNSSALLMAASQYLDVPGYNAILFRRTFADLALPGALMDRARSWWGGLDGVTWNSNSNTFTFPSGARVTFGYLNNTQDYLRYKGCTHPDTEVLTDKGWKRIPEVQVGDLVASMNPKTREWDYQPVTHTWEYDHDSVLYEPRPGSDVAFSVTDNHTWWVSTQRRKDLRKYRTDELPKVAKFPQAGRFVGGVDPGVALFPRSARGHQKSGDLIFSAEDWATFLGWYIAEGHTGSGSITISQHDGPSMEAKSAIHDLARRSGAHVNWTPRALVFTNAKLAAWLDEHTGKGAHSKRIPSEVFTWKTKYARLLLQSLVEGDGTWRTDKSAHFVTVSRQLADDVMRLAQHCGFRATLDERHDRTTTPDGVERDVVAFHIYLLEKVDVDTGISLNVDSEPIVTRPYTGKVYCLTVPPHHTFLTRYMGRVIWTGNSEFSFIGMDEVTEIREADYRYLFSRLRRPASGPLSKVPLRMRAASNPAPNWVRQRFIVEGKEHNRIFVPSRLTDNPGVDADSYRQALSQLDPIERRRLEFGDWWATTLGSLFRREEFVIIDPGEVPDVKTTARAVRFWDLAGTEPSKSYPDPDWTVGTLMLFDEGIAYVLDVKRMRGKPDAVQKFVAQTAYEDGRNVAIRMEREPGSSGVQVADDYARYVLPGYDFEAIPSSGDKIVRARPFSAAAANGNVRLVRGPWLNEWLDELSSFPEACTHDDQVDSVTGAFAYVTGLGYPQRRKARIIV